MAVASEATDWIWPAGEKPVPVEPSRSTELPEKARLPKPSASPTRSTEGAPGTLPGCGIDWNVASPGQFRTAVSLSKLSLMTMLASRRPHRPGGPWRPGWRGESSCDCLSSDHAFAWDRPVPDVGQSPILELRRALSRRVNAASTLFSCCVCEYFVVARGARLGSSLGGEPRPPMISRGRPSGLGKRKRRRFFRTGGVLGIEIRAPLVQAAVTFASLRRLLRIAAPRPPKPNIMTAQVAGSGTAVARLTLSRLVPMF